MKHRLEILHQETEIWGVWRYGTQPQFGFSLIIKLLLSASVSLPVKYQERQVGDIHVSLSLSPFPSLLSLESFPTYHSHVSWSFMWNWFATFGLTRWCPSSLLALSLEFSFFRRISFSNYVAALSSRTLISKLNPEGICLKTPSSPKNILRVGSLRLTRYLNHMLWIWSLARDLFHQ